MSLFDHIKKMQEPKPEVSVPGKFEEVSMPEVAAPDLSINEVVSSLMEAHQPVIEAAEPQIITDPSLTPEHQRFSVGIDLGTTHCVLSYAKIDDTDEAFVQQVMGIPQLTSPGMIEDSYQLPSFLYQAHDAELAEGATALPWTAKPQFLVGEIARNLGSKTPIRLVSSAKSWLCHAGVDCKSPILPTEAPEDVERVSPFQASVAYLQHISDAWHYKYPNAPLSQ